MYFPLIYKYFSLLSLFFLMKDTVTWVNIQIGNDCDENYSMYVSYNHFNHSSYVYVFLYIFHCVFILF